MNDLSQKIVEKIKHDGIKPEARWKHALKRSLVWLGVVFAVVFGALSLGIVVLTLLELDESIFSFRPTRLLSPPVIAALPPVWLLAAGVFFVLAVIGFRNTRHGYRHRAIAIAGIIFFLLFSGAAIAEFTGVNRFANDSLRNRFPMGPSLGEKRTAFWSQPQEGFLAGTITSTESPDFSLRDFQGNTWNIRVTEKTKIRPLADIVPGQSVKIIGNRVEDRVFEAEDIRPWRKPLPGIPPGRGMPMRPGDGPWNYR